MNCLDPSTQGKRVTQKKKKARRLSHLRGNMCPRQCRRAGAWWGVKVCMERIDLVGDADRDASPTPHPFTRHSTTDTRHPTPDTRHPTPVTLHPPPSTLHPPPSTLHPTPYTLDPERSREGNVMSRTCGKARVLGSVGAPERGGVLRGRARRHRHAQRSQQHLQYFSVSSMMYYSLITPINAQRQMHA